MTPSDAARFLVGSRSAILRLAGCRWSLVVGLLLVLSGSLARSYDGAYLPREWPVLLRGVLVSVGNAFILYSLMHLTVRLRKGVTPSFLTGYACFLGLFWMTAPMAWVYAIPYERWLDPVDAVRANLNTLALISVWRVALITRVLATLFKAPFSPTLFLVLLFSDVAVVVGASLAPAPLVDIMGGLHHDPVDELLADANLLTKVYGVLAFPILLICALAGLRWMKGEWTVQTPRWEHPPRLLIAIAAASVLFWVVPLVRTQPEQRNRWQAEHLLRSGDVKGGIAMLTGRARDAFPPIWDPPPRLSYGERLPSLESIATALLEQPPEPWVIALYLDKSKRHFFSLRVNSWLGVADAISSTDYRGSDLIEGRAQRLRMHLRFDASLTEADRVQIERAIEYLAQQPRDWPSEGAK